MEYLTLLSQEFLLMALILIVLVIKLVEKEDHKRKNKTFAVVIGLLFLNFIAGLFMPFKGETFAGMFQVQEIEVWQKNILNAGLFLIGLQAYDWYRRSIKMLEFFMLLLFSLLGMFFMISSGHFLVFYLGLELATLPLIILTAIDIKKQRSAEAGMKFILSSMFSSAILVMGLSFIYGGAGSFYFSSISLVGANVILIAGLALLITGFAFKLSLVPFHLWTADVYEGAPINVATFLSVISKGAVFFIFLTTLYKVFPGIEYIWDKLIMGLAVITMTVGNLFALRQTNMKRFLAFSSIAQAGYILLGVVAGGAMGVTAVTYFILVYLFSNIAAFGVASAISARTGKENITDYNGLYTSHPMLSIVLFMALFSLAGIPPLAGFFGKFFLLMAAAGKGLYILVAIAAVNMIISLYYYLKVIKAIFMDKTETPVRAFKSSLATRISLTVCAVGIFTIGFFGYIYDFIHELSLIIFP